ncbi:MAG: winged helix-turn-helix transcriptional regulator [Candidatus Omnitrophica bacterium]|nr:winged helix-turn-helix transcriptional regulator [Candidatus Omnitrophota bacterium]
MKRKIVVAREVGRIMPGIARAIVVGFSQHIDLTPAQLFTLLAIAENGKCCFSELSQMMFVSAPTTTGIVDRLQRGGYVKRVPSKEDRRVINICLTLKGVKVAKFVQDSVVKHWEIILDKLSLADCEHYLKIIKKIKAHVDKGPGHFK